MREEFPWSVDSDGIRWQQSLGESNAHQTLLSSRIPSGTVFDQGPSTRRWSSRSVECDANGLYRLGTARVNQEVATGREKIIETNRCACASKRRGRRRVLIKFRKTRSRKRRVRLGNLKNLTALMSTRVLDTRRKETQRTRSRRERCLCFPTRV